MDKLPSILIKSISLGIIAWAFCFYCFGQSASSALIWSKLKGIEEDTSLSVKEKLPLVLALKRQFEDQHLAVDSVYARILHRLGLFAVKLNNEVPTSEAINLTQASVRINSAGKKSSSTYFSVISYTNLGNYYRTLHLYNVALQYYDSALLQRKRFTSHNTSAVGLMLAKAQMLYWTGDYQKAIEELDFAILRAKESGDSTYMPVLFNQRAQSYIMQNRTQEALRDVETASSLSGLLDNQHEKINSMLLKADIFAKARDFSKVLPLYKKGIEERLKTTRYSQISDDYTDLGNFYLHDLKNYNKAKACYFLTIDYARKAHDFERLSKGHINLELVSLYQNNYKDAERYCIEAISDLNVISGKSILANPAASQLNSIGNKDLVHVIFGNKTELLLKQFIRTGDHHYLTACLETALLTDTLLTNIRHEQLGEQSKLYWRNFTREFFSHAMEACYLANDVTLAFYFLEKSRAVLLHDKLNELGASAHLPQAEAVKERELQLAVIAEQQKSASSDNQEGSPGAPQAKLAEAKEMLEHYLKSLENSYPAYYQYKYSDEVPSLNYLQTQLRKHRQSFIHYFINDTVAYILGITSSDAKLTKLSGNTFNSGMLLDFLQQCANEPVSSNAYRSFSSLSHTLYLLLFKPMGIPAGRVVICPDNFLIPFDALCADDTGNSYLVKDYIFSYVYSAGYLLKEPDLTPAGKDFIGFAPISFKAYTDVADLKQSGDALKQSARHYNSATVLTSKNASRHNFINAIPGYTVVNVFSHGLADTTGNEPVLYMYDSIIHLSELQLLYKPAVQLAVLSACQTNVGKNAKGEGILSLARGFAAAGIPSVAATLWQADERSIYAISEKFHAYLSQGMPKDEALQKAKLFFIQNGEHEISFPYYWANMILAGNSDAITLSKNRPVWPWVIAISLIAATGLLLIGRSRV